MITWCRITSIWDEALRLCEGDEMPQERWGMDLTLGHAKKGQPISCKREGSWAIYAFFPTACSRGRDRTRVNARTSQSRHESMWSNYLHAFGKAYLLVSAHRHKIGFINIKSLVERECTANRIWWWHSWLWRFVVHIYVQRDSSPRRRSCLRCLMRNRAVDALKRQVNCPQSTDSYWLSGTPYLCMMSFSRLLGGPFVQIIKYLWLRMEYMCFAALRFRSHLECVIATAMDDCNR